MQASIQSLTILKHLKSIVLTVSSNYEDEKKIEQMLMKAQAVLTASPSIESMERKTLIVKRPGETDTTFYI